MATKKTKKKSKKTAKKSAKNVKSKGLKKTQAESVLHSDIADSSNYILMYTTVGGGSEGGGPGGTQPVKCDVFAPAPEPAKKKPWWKFW